MPPEVIDSFSVPTQHVPFLPENPSSICILLNAVANGLHCLSRHALGLVINLHLHMPHMSPCYTANQQEVVL